MLMILHQNPNVIPGSLLACMLLFGACTASPGDVANGDDPLAALGAPVQTTRYQADFWVREAERAPERYRDAVAYCEERELAEYPNCREVHRAVSILRYAEHPAPVGQGFTGKLEADASDSLSRP